MINNRNPWCLAVAGTGVAILAIGLLIFHPRPAEAQGSTPKYEVDPFWPRPLPNQWVTGSVGACVRTLKTMYSSLTGAT